MFEPSGATPSGTNTFLYLQYPAISKDHFLTSERPPIVLDSADVKK